MSNLLDDGKPGSLRYAVDAALPKSTITFDAGLHGTILLSNGDLNIAKDLKILGPGAGILSISGGKSGKMVRVVQRVTVTISGLTFKDSKTSSQAFIDNEGTLMLSNTIVSGNNGGGISNGGKLTLNNSIVSGNMAGGIINADTLMLSNSTVSDNTASFGGGGIYNVGTLTFNNSTISRNTASFGGGISNRYINMGPDREGTLTLNNSTISGNIAGSSGGGIFIWGNSQLSITQVDLDLTFSTIYGNTAHRGGDIAIEDLDSNGKPINQLSQVRISNSIVAADPTHPGPDIIGRLTSYGYNLFQDNSGATFDPATAALHGTDKTLSVNDLKIDPVLRDNGGSTKPHTLTNALLLGSPAIDAIPLRYCQVKGILNSQSRMYTDQRGVKRPDGKEQFCDIGAYEYTD